MQPFFLFHVVPFFALLQSGTFVGWSVYRKARRTPRHRRHQRSAIDLAREPGLHRCWFGALDVTSCSLFRAVRLSGQSGFTITFSCKKKKHAKPLTFLPASNGIGQARKRSGKSLVNEHLHSESAMQAQGRCWSLSCPALAMPLADYQ